MRTGVPVPIASVRWRDQTTVEGRVRSMRTRPWADAAATSLECTLTDGTGGIEVVFLGRRRVGGVELGARMRVSGRIGIHHHRLAFLNPVYELVIP